MEGRSLRWGTTVKICKALQNWGPLAAWHGWSAHSQQNQLWGNGNAGREGLQSFFLPFLVGKKAVCTLSRHCVLQQGQVLRPFILHLILNLFSDQQAFCVTYVMGTFFDFAMFVDERWQKEAIEQDSWQICLVQVFFQVWQPQHGISSSNEAMEGIFMGPTCPAA